MQVGEKVLFLLGEAGQLAHASQQALVHRESIPFWFIEGLLDLGEGLEFCSDDVGVAR